MKKFLLFLFLYTGFMGCCGDVKSNWAVSDFSIAVLGEQNQVVENGEIVADSIQLLLDITPSFSMIEGVQNPFMSSAFATSCESDGHMGMSDRIVAMTLTSAFEFNGKEPGESLNQHVSYESTRGMIDWANDVEDNEFQFSRNTIFFVGDKPDISTQQQFKITMELQSGKIVESETVEFVWL